MQMPRMHIAGEGFAVADAAVLDAHRNVVAGDKDAVQFRLVARHHQAANIRRKMIGMTGIAAAVLRMRRIPIEVGIGNAEGATKPAPMTTIAPSASSALRILERSFSCLHSPACR